MIPILIDIDAVFGLISMGILMKGVEWCCYRVNINDTNIDIDWCIFRVNIVEYHCRRSSDDVIRLILMMQILMHINTVFEWMWCNITSGGQKMLLSENWRCKYWCRLMQFLSECIGILLQGRVMLLLGEYQWCKYWFRLMHFSSLYSGIMI